MLEKEKLQVKNQKLCIKMQCISVFLDIGKFADFWQKSAGVSRTQGLYHVIHVLFIIFW